MDVWLPSTNCGIATYPNRAMGMTGLSPARLRPCRPLHQTPVVSWLLAIAHPGLLPSSACKLSAFPSRPLKDILLSTTIHISGLHHAACLLATPGFVRPLTGRHAGSLLTGWLGVSQVGFAPCGRSPTGKQQPISWRNLQSQGFGLTLARASV
jgi:hypothetical protein